MSNVVRLSLADYEGESMADEPKGGADNGGEGGKGGGETNALKDLLDSLARIDLVLGDDTTLETLVDRLKVAVETKLAHLGEGEEEEEEEEEVPPVAGEPEPAPAGGPIMMSFGGRRYQLVPQSKGKGQPKKPAAAPAPTQLSHGDPRSARLEANLLKKERESIAGRIKALFDSGRITKPIHDTLAREAGTVRLSLDDNGQLGSNAVLAKVEAYEALPAGTTWSGGGPLPAGVAPLPHPPGAWGAEGSPAAVAEQVDAFFDLLTGGRK